MTVAAKGVKGEAYNVCNDAETRSICEIAELVAEEVAGGRIKIVRDIQEEDSFGYALDNTMRLCSEKIRGLGWTAKVSMPKVLLPYPAEIQNGKIGQSVVNYG